MRALPVSCRKAAARASAEPSVRPLTKTATGRLQRRWEPEPEAELLPHWRTDSVRSEKSATDSPAAGRESPEANRRSRTSPVALVVQAVSLSAFRSAAGEPALTRPIRRYKIPPSSRSRRATKSWMGEGIGAAFGEGVVGAASRRRTPNRSISAWEAWASNSVDPRARFVRSTLINSGSGGDETGASPRRLDISTVPNIPMNRRVFCLAAMAGL